MNDEIAFTHQFVEFIPEKLQERTLYISIRFATVAHPCACGCGSKVVTPLKPTDWKLIFDGKTISLYPSIGNWSFACQSHYWVKNNVIQWDVQWSRTEIEAGRSHDRAAKERYYERPSLPSAPEPTKPARVTERIWQRLSKWWHSQWGPGDKR